MFKRMSKKQAVAAPAEQQARSELPVDESLAALSRDLSGLGGIEIGQAAKERGWAAVQRELERRPVRTAAPLAAKSSAGKPIGSPQPAGHTVAWRWIAGGAVVAVAVIATLLGLLLPGGTGPIVVSSTTTTAAFVQNTEVTQPNTTASIPETTTPTSENAPTTVPSTTPGTEGTTSTMTTDQTTPTTGSTTDTGKTTSTTINSPRTTPTNPNQQNARAELEKDAVNVALDLGKAVLEYFPDKESLTGIRSLVAPEAQPGLTWMIGRLEQPNSSQRSGEPKWISSDVVKVNLVFNDIDPERLENGQPKSVEKHFWLTIRVTSESATVIDISAAP